MLTVITFIVFLAMTSVLLLNFSLKESDIMAGILGMILVLCCFGLAITFDIAKAKSEQPICKSKTQAEAAAALPEKPAEVTDTTPTDADSKVAAVAYSGIIPVSGELWCDKPDPNPYVDKDKAIKFCFKILDVDLKGDKCFMKYKQYSRYKNTLNNGFITTDRCSMIDFMEKEYDTLVYRDSE